MTLFHRILAPEVLFWLSYPVLAVRLWRVG